MRREGEGRRLSSAQGWWMVGLLAVYHALSIIDRHVISMVIDQIKGDIHLSDFQMGILIGPAVSVSYAVCGLAFGWAADRYSRRHVIFVGIVMWSLATAACGLGDSFWSLFAARAFVGMGEAALVPAAYSLIADGMRSSRATTAISLFAAAPKWGQAATYALGGLILLHFSRLLDQGAHLGGLVPWQLTFVSLGVVGVVLSPLLFTFPEPLRDPPGDAARAATSGAAAFCRRNAGLLALLIASTVLTTIVTHAIYTWAPSFLGRTFHWTPAQYGPPIGLVSLIAGTSMVGHGRIVDLLFKRGIQDIHIRYYTWTLAAAIPLAIGG